MIRFQGKIPLTIFPTFWLFAALIGYLNSSSFIGTLIWMGVILLSVLFHELGHALTALLFGQKPRIELVALGGLTYHETPQGSPKKLSLWRQFLIVLNGPLFGFLLAVIASLLLYIPGWSQGVSGSILSLIRLVNLFWTVVNLLPVLPLDGGQLLRIALEKCFGVKGVRYALYASLFIAVGLGAFFFLSQALLIGSLFCLFAFQSYDLLRKTRHLSRDDQNTALREKLEQAEFYLQTQQKQDAVRLCEEIRSLTHTGVIFETATQYLAFLSYEEKNLARVYDLLIGLKEHLKGDALCLLQKAAFSQKDFALVIKLSGHCFQNRPTVDIALCNAYAHAQMGEVEPAVGWIQTACDEGLANLKEVVNNPLFDPVRTAPFFKEFINDASKQ